MLTRRIRFPGEPDEVAYLTAPATEISSTAQDAKTAALSREFAVSNAAESSSVALRSAAAPLLSAVFASSCLAGATQAGSRVRPRQYRGGMVTFGAVLASTGCAGIALVLTGWKFFAVHAHGRAPPAPYWVRAPLPRTTPRPWAGARSESRPTAALCSGRNPKTASPAFV